MLPAGGASGLRGWREPRFAPPNQDSRETSVLAGGGGPQETQMHDVHVLLLSLPPPVDEFANRVHLGYSCTL